MSDLDSLLDLLRVLADSTRPAHERAQAGRTLASRALKRCQEIDADERAEIRRRVRQEAGRYAARTVGEA